MNPYDTLGISSTASAEEIKRAYRQKAKAHHPDVGGQGFEDIAKAYALLTDAEARARFDETGHTDAPPPAMAILVAMFAKVIELGLDKENIVESIRSALKGGGEDLRHKILEQQCEVARLKRLSGRVTTTTGPNLFEEILTQKIAKAERQIAHFQGERRRGQEALELLSSFSDSFTPSTGNAPGKLKPQWTFL